MNYITAPTISGKVTGSPFLLSTPPIPLPKGRSHFSRFTKSDGMPMAREDAVGLNAVSAFKSWDASGPLQNTTLRCFLFSQCPLRCSTGTQDFTQPAQDTHTAPAHRTMHPEDPRSPASGPAGTGKSSHEAALRR